MLREKAPPIKPGEFFMIRTAPKSSIMRAGIFQCTGEQQIKEGNRKPERALTFTHQGKGYIEPEKNCVRLGGN